MVRVVTALKAWEPVYQQRHPHPFMEAPIGIGAIQGGYPYKPSKCPAPFCNLYVDLRLVPGQSFVEGRLVPANEAIGLDHATEITVTPLHNLFAPRLDELPDLVSSLPGAPSREGARQ